MTSRLGKGVILGIAAGIAGIVASLTPFGLALEENLGLEILFRLRGHREPPPDVVVVSIDRESADRLNLPDDPRKWPRSLHARLTETLAKEGAAVIAFDVFFAEPTRGGDDLAFARAIRKANNVVLCEWLECEEMALTGRGGAYRGKVEIARRLAPVPELANAAIATTPYPIPKIPVKVSWDWSFWKAGGETPTMPVVVFQLYAIGEHDDFARLVDRAFPAKPPGLARSVEEVFAAGNVEEGILAIRKIFEEEPQAEERMLAALRRSDPTPADGNRFRLLRSMIRLYGGGDTKFLNFYGPPRTIATVPYWQALEAGSGEDRGEGGTDLRGKAVFVGSSESRQLAQKDGFYTVFTQENGVDLSGVEIAATAFANLLEDMPLRPLPLHWLVVLLLLWGLSAGVLSASFLPSRSALGVAGLCLLYLGAAEHRFAAAGAWHPIIVPVLLQAPLVLAGAVAWNYVDLNRERRNFRRAFEYYLPVDVVDELAKNIAGLKVSNQLVNGVCLATDAERYTSLAESMGPKDLAGFMNRYYEAVFDPVKRHGGMVSNVIGDSMLAIWLAERGKPDPLNEACLAAIEIVGAMRELGEPGESTRLPTRIGLHSGDILLGNIGAGHHFEYRPVGDIVNTATRIEGLNKNLGTRILVSREVAAGIHGFLTRDLGLFLLAGKTRPVHVHELLCRADEAQASLRRLCAVFAEGLEAFRRQSWEMSVGHFREALEVREGDGPSLFYLQLCARYSQNPPGSSWDGVIHVEGK